MIAISELRQYIEYDPTYGKLIYCKTGKVANSKTSKGYIRLKINGQEILGHRAAWALTFNSWPHGFIDHINENKLDNRLCNLRVTTHAENLHNQHLPTCRSTTGIRGVSKSRNKFKVHICTNKHNQYIGTFNTLKQAEQAYLAAKLQQHTLIGDTNV